jgi:hypothetical protein
MLSGMTAMTVFHPSIFQVIRRFPEHREEILRLHNNSELFRTICSDYKKCKKALLYWSSLNSGESSVRREEYEDLLQSLESEIIACLAGSELPREA